MRPLLFGLEEYRSRLPTTDLYFLSPLKHLIRQGADVPRPVWLGANAYAVGETGVVSRYGSERDLERLSARGARRLVYIADDDFAAGAIDPGLPQPYRAKLASFAQEAWPTLKTAADVVIVPSPALAEIYGAKALILHPAWARDPAGTSHFERPRRVEIAHLGTGSHGSDLAPLAGPIAALLQANSDTRLTLFATTDPPSELSRHPRVRLRRQMPWWRYKHLLPWMRFHLAIYPLRDSAFNRARSANKLFEHALVGAASLMSPIPALLGATSGASTGVFVEGGPDEWRARIEADLADPAAARARAERVGKHISEIDPLGAAAERWLAILTGGT